MIKLEYMEDKPLFCEMAKLTKKWASKEFGDFGNILYFSPKNHNGDPRVKFGGGTKETDRTENAPTLSFTKDFHYELILQPWMNSDNCPNAFDKKYIEKVENFVTKAMPILLFVWFLKLDEADALEYFKGNLTFHEIIAELKDIENKYYDEIQGLNNLDELYEYGMKNNLFTF